MKPVAGATFGPAVWSDTISTCAGSPPLPTTIAVEALPATSGTPAADASAPPAPPRRVIDRSWRPGGTDA